MFDSLFEIGRPKHARRPVLEPCEVRALLAPLVSPITIPAGVAETAVAGQPWHGAVHLDQSWNWLILTVNYGDGTPTQQLRLPGATGNVQVTHTFAPSATYPATHQVTFAAGGGGWPLVGYYATVSVEVTASGAGHGADHGHHDQNHGQHRQDHGSRLKVV